MPLQVSGLQNELKNAFSEAHSSASLAGKDIATAINNYIQGIQNAGGGTFNSCPGISSLGTTIGNIFEEQMVSGKLVGNRIATEINSALQTIITTYQTGTPITAAGLPGFLSDMQSLHDDKAQNGKLYGQQLGTVINTFVSQFVIAGVIPGAPPAPFTGTVS